MNTPVKIATISTRHDMLNGGYHGYILWFAADGSLRHRRLFTGLQGTMREAVELCRARIDEVVAAQPQRVKPDKWRGRTLYGFFIEEPA